MMNLKRRFMFGNMRWYCDLTEYLDDLLGVSNNIKGAWCYLEYDYTNYKYNNTNVFAIRHPGKTIGSITASDIGSIEKIELCIDGINCDIVKDKFIGVHIDLDEFSKIKFVRNNTIGNKQVLWFIANFVYHLGSTNDSSKFINDEFMHGYCYYFAVILKDAFQRGNICYAYHLGHMVWVDIDGIPYDINGVHNSAKYYIPIEYLKKGINDFKRVPGIGFNASKEFVDKVVKEYERDNGIIRCDE